MKNFKTMIFVLLICFLDIVGLYAYINVHILHNELLVTQNEIEIAQTMISNQSNQLSELLSNQKVLEDKVLELQNQYEIINDEINNDEYKDLIFTSAKDIVKESTQLNRWGITLTEEEVELLARILMLEAGGECDWGKDAVVEVIFNRIYDEDFPDTLEGVLSQSNPIQFTTWKNRNSEAATPTEEVYESIHCVLSGQTDILPFETVYFGRTAQNDKIQLTIENHVFCNK